MILNQLTIPSADLEISISFYQKLGFTLLVDSRPRYVRFVCPDGNTTFSLHHQDSLPIGEGISIYFECTDLDQRVRDLKANGFAFLEDPNDKPWLWREAHLKDPDGNKLVLYYAGENRLNPPWKVKPV